MDARPVMASAPVPDVDLDEPLERQGWAHLVATVERLQRERDDAVTLLGSLLRVGQGWGAYARWAQDGNEKDADTLSGIDAARADAQMFLARLAVPSEPTEAE